MSLSPRTSLLSRVKSWCGLNVILKREEINAKKKVRDVRECSFGEYDLSQ